VNPFPPNLTASALFEIVKDVPREAWPNEVHCNRQEWGQSVHISVAAHAFNGAMAARVLGKGGVISPCSDIPHAAVSIGQFVWTAPTLLEALAAACREGK